MADVNFSGDLKRLTLRPGDRFVLTVDEIFSMDDAEAILAAWKNFWDDRDEPPSLLILQKDMDLQIVEGPTDG